MQQSNARFVSHVRSSRRSLAPGSRHDQPATGRSLAPWSPRDQPPTGATDLWRRTRRQARRLDAVIVMVVRTKEGRERQTLQRWLTSADRRAARPHPRVQCRGRTCGRSRSNCSKRRASTSPPRTATSRQRRDDTDERSPRKRPQLPATRDQGFQPSQGTRVRASRTSQLRRSPGAASRFTKPVCRKPSGAKRAILEPSRCGAPKLQIMLLASRKRLHAEAKGWERTMTVIGRFFTLEPENLR